MPTKVPRMEPGLAAGSRPVNDPMACIGNLVSVFAIPAISRECDSRQVIADSLEVLLGMLRLDFAYASFADATGGAPIVLIRTRQSGEAAVVRRHIAPVISVSLPEGPPKPAVVV